MRARSPASIPPESVLVVGKIFSSGGLKMGCFWGQNNLK